MIRGRASCRYYKWTTMRVHYMNRIPSKLASSLMIESLIVALGGLFFSACTAQGAQSPKGDRAGLLPARVAGFQGEGRLRPIHVAGFCRTCRQQRWRTRPVHGRFPIRSRTAIATTEMGDRAAQSLKARSCSCMCVSRSSQAPPLVLGEIFRVHDGKSSSTGTFSSPGRNIRLTLTLMF